MGWAIVTIDDIKAASKHSLVGGPFGSDLVISDYVEDGVPVIRGVNLSRDGLFSEHDFVFVREEKAEALLANNAYPGDLIVTQRGTLGQVGLIPESSRYQRFVISQSQMKLTVSKEKADARYVYYFFRSPNTVQKIKNHAISSGVPHINLGILKELEIPLPSLETQRKIASTLSAYDDLIENNLRRIALLEESARLLYKEWFVRLRFPGYEHTRIVDGVPDVWERVAFEEAVVLQRGFDLPVQDREVGSVPVYGSTGIVGFHNKPKVSGPGVVTGRSGTLGKVHYIAEDFWPLNTALWVREFMLVSPIYAFFLLKNLQLDQFNGGVSVPTLDRKAVHRLRIMVPSKTLMRLFDECALAMFALVRKLQLQNNKLQEARDLLLPRLMTGEIDV